MWLILSVCISVGMHTLAQKTTLRKLVLSFSLGQGVSLFEHILIYVLGWLASKIPGVSPISTSQTSAGTMDVYHHICFVCGFWELTSGQAGVANSFTHLVISQPPNMIFKICYTI